MSGTSLNKSFGVTYYDKKKAFNGYTLFAPMWGKVTWLIDMEGNIVHRWKFNKRPGDFPYFLPNGNLLYPERLPIPKILFAGGCGSDCLEVDWNNNLVWKHTDYEQHHLVRRLRNGNTLFLRIEQVPSDISHKIKGGVPGSEGDNNIIVGDCFREITPDGETVWEWKSFEHLDFDVFSICPLEARADWIHCNSCVEMPNGNILACFRNQDMLVEINKKNGNIEWYWGRGEIKHPHMASCLENGNIMCFDNGSHRENCLFDYSRVVEINPKKNEIIWEYIDKTPLSFYSLLISGAQRLSNGNTLITEGSKGRIFEVTMDKETVWEYHCPFYNTTGLKSISGWHNWLHRSYRHPVDYSAFSGKDLDPDKYKEFNLIYGSGAYKRI